MATETLSFDILARDLASSSFKNMGRAALDASASMKELSSRLDKISGRVATAKVGLKGDKEAQVEADKLHLKLVQLGRQVANPNIGLEGYLRTSARIGEVELALDKLDHRRVTATVDVNVNRRGLRGLLSGLGGLGSEAFSGGLGSPVGIGGLIGGGALAAGLVPGVVGLGIGGLTGLGAVAGGSFGAAAGKKQLAADLANIKTITTALKTAVGQQKTDLSAALRAANKQYAKDSAFFQPFTDFENAIKGLEKTVIAPLRPVMEPLVGIIKEFGKGLTGLGPQFTALFRGSLPFIRQFLQFMLQAGKILLPAFTQALNQMVKSGALQQMTQALVVLTEGLATFIENLGPGMKASAVIFARLATQTGRVLGFLGSLFTVFAKVLTFDVPGAARKGVQAVVASFNWWKDRLSSIVDAVVGWFAKLPGRILGALFGLGHSLYGFAHAALNEMWDGFKAVGGSILSWLGGFVSRLIGTVKKILHIGSPSAVFHEIGVNMMLGLERGIKASAHRAANAVRGAVGSAAGPTSASAAQAQAYARTRLGAFGWSLAQMAPLIALWNQESGWNRFARNPSSGAYGIPQALPPGKMGPAANPPTSSAAAQINWGLGYIKSVYGSPAGAWAHERAFNWYGKGGIIGEPVLGIGLRSGRGYGFGEHGPEMVVPRGGGGGKIVLEIRSTGSSDFDRFMTNWLQRSVRDTGGGDVQVAFGTAY